MAGVLINLQVDGPRWQLTGNAAERHRAPAGLEVGTPSHTAGSSAIARHLPTGTSAWPYALMLADPPSAAHRGNKPTDSPCTPTKSKSPERATQNAENERLQHNERVSQQ